MQRAGCTHEQPFCFSKGHDGQASLVCLPCECSGKRGSYNEAPLCHTRINGAWHPAGLSELERLLPEHVLPKPTLDLTDASGLDSTESLWTLEVSLPTTMPGNLRLLSPLSAPNPN